MRILTFGPHRETVGGKVRLGSTYYIEADYTKVAVRIYAANAPYKDALIDIFDDGVSIFNNRTVSTHNRITGADTTGAAVTAAILYEGENGEDKEDDFTEGDIAEGSWVHCELVDTGGGDNFTVQFEISPADEG